MIFALAGNQNCGKTTLFNQLTGSNQHVGNFPGVTVDQKSGAIRGEKDCTVVDLPGIYSIRPYTPEEIVTRDFILNQKPDGLINIVDATNIERNLYLTLQLMEMRIPMVLALNMMDEVTAGGGTIDVKGMSQALGIPVVPISAVKNQGVDELVKVAVQTARTKTLPTVYDFCSPGPVHRCIHAVVHQIEDHAEAAGLPVRFAATKLIEGDEDIVTRLALDQNELELIEHSVKEMEDECGMDRNAALADMRYTFIETICSGTVNRFRRPIRRRISGTSRYPAPCRGVYTILRLSATSRTARGLTACFSTSARYASSMSRPSRVIFPALSACPKSTVWTSAKMSRLSMTDATTSACSGGSCAPSSQYAL